MRRRRTRPEHPFEGINATPMIDVVMCLIIFFLLVGKLGAERSRQVMLPESQVGETEKAVDPMVIDIMRADAVQADFPGTSAWGGGIARVQIEGRDVTDAPTLKSLIHDRIVERPDTSIEIRADRELPFAAIEPVLRACGDAGATSVRLAAEKQL